MNADEILAPLPEAFETALAKAFSDDLPVPIRAAMDPARTPLSILPWLAAHRGVRLWYSDWSEARRRQMAEEAPELAALVGTRAAAARFLAFVDAEIIDKASYPNPFVIGRAALGRAPLQHGPWLARHLVRVRTYTPPRALVLGRGVLGRARLKTPSQEPFRRVMAAFRAAKSPETEYRVDFGHLRPLRLGDAPLLDGSHALGDYVARTRI